MASANAFEFYCYRFSIWNIFAIMNNTHFMKLQIKHVRYQFGCLPQHYRTLKLKYY